ncbi:hypothetical protein [Polyangium aurulentum]|uniref:hypothetical protein n=1 Tax=Polyangium aurulentum TaxID=2567896 RepID=UPI0010ADAA41|nr:hypothetical protein [Polyangium aurulentum]UQA61938.1 hypothetical protein E8A73_016285 [Polyangium aurulentum]
MLGERLLRALPALREEKLRTAFLRSELEREGIEGAARALDAVSALAEQADPTAREVIAALVPLLSDPAQAAWIESLREVARREALLSLSRLLRRRGASKSVPPPAPEERGHAIEPGGRRLTLGERRALARRPTRATLDKLLADPHPMVISNLLANPRLTEDDVVRMAAQRPARREVIVEIAKSPSWVKRARVRMAIVLNPLSPPEISVPLLSLLIRPELEQVAGASFVPKVVRSAAMDLLARRPPPRNHGGGGPVQ